ncbi:hypothetical protein GCM10007868_24860 [Gluconobacter frateurii]|uniref:Secreted protein n=1 Tax=Gluconobacter frateurii NRIC 0228 TaxID=1307946 RepID=A0ABQ0Q730_9PROT|nr:hypothetical protein AA0228_0024 [Gluconobacter frateurii NRIC 0228]GLP91411.1 hypothetical protein GCM10007868_24860 [Gluconobacter frateurii]
MAAADRLVRCRLTARIVAVALKVNFALIEAVEGLRQPRLAAPCWFWRLVAGNAETSELAVIAAPRTRFCQPMPQFCITQTSMVRVVVLLELVTCSLTTIPGMADFAPGTGA